MTPTVRWTIEGILFTAGLLALLIPNLPAAPDAPWLNQHNIFLSDVSGLDSYLLCQTQQPETEVRGWLGIGIQQTCAFHGRTMSMQTMITDVFRGSPAQQAGLQPGDIILKVDRRHIGHPVVLQNAIGELEPGTSVTFTIERAGREYIQSATLGAWITSPKSQSSSKGVFNAQSMEP